MSICCKGHLLTEYESKGFLLSYCYKLAFRHFIHAVAHFTLLCHVWIWPCPAPKRVSKNSSVEVDVGTVFFLTAFNQNKLLINCNSCKSTSPIRHHTHTCLTSAQEKKNAIIGIIMIMYPVL